MTELSATAYFWFVALGLTIGAIFGLVITSYGVSVRANIAWGIGGAVITGTLGIMMGLGDGLLFALAGTMAMLYLVNVFHQHHVEDVFGHTDREIRILPKQKLE